MHTATGLPPVAAQMAADSLLAAPRIACASSLDGSVRLAAICVIDSPWSTPGEKPIPDPETTNRLSTSTKGKVPVPGT